MNKERFDYISSIIDAVEEQSTIHDLGQQIKKAIIDGGISSDELTAYKKVLAKKMKSEDDEFFGN